MQQAYLTITFQRSRYAIPQLCISSVFESPTGPYPIGVFEANLFTWTHFEAIIPCLVIDPGPLKFLIHPNAEGDDERERNHAQRAIRTEE